MIIKYVNMFVKGYASSEVSLSVYWVIYQAGIFQSQSWLTNTNNTYTSQILIGDVTRSRVRCGVNGVHRLVPAQMTLTLVMAILQSYSRATDAK